MRFAGRIDPGSGGAVRTGQPVFFKPARIDATREMLSRMVRDFGCVASSSMIAESRLPCFPAVVAALELVSAGATPDSAPGTFAPAAPGDIDAPTAVKACAGRLAAVSLVDLADPRSPQATSSEANTKTFSRIAV